MRTWTRRTKVQGMEEGRGKITVAEVGQRREQGGGGGGRRRKTLGRKGAEEAAAAPVSPVRSCMASKASCLLPPPPVRVRGGFQGVLGGYSTHGIEGKHFWKSGREGGGGVGIVRSF